ncbi:PREDICTED: HAUS augmin-like complex subunit 8 [Calidris pugnax]|uniref:HAUS augmin-like complex subunit 8 n=1 Tax=Calidris pugnax TaxID=198806 RepID=UPI00071C93D8|nr:PREDICTED: HAUS augmin-like complex subunit 8 [Calidris pugnax]XP_014808281.1 PREDICTED: HAUS augmin-like complex subunit 8 [Calidris pugnax]
MSELEGDTSGTVEDEEVSKPKRRGKRIVKSRYLQYDKKNAKKVTSNLFSTSVVKSSTATKPKSVLPLKCKASAGVINSSLNQSRFQKGVLQSTLLNGDKTNRPEFDLSAINGKTVCEKTFEADSAWEDTDTSKEGKTVREDSDVLELLESQTLLLTCLRIKAGNNLAEIEEKGEKDLITLCEEKERQQEKLFKLKREILLKEREQKLDDALDKQIEVLSSLVPVCERFKEQYKSFAVSLDATRHELPIKNIHIEGDTPTFLGMKI